MASEIHKKRTGKGFKISEEIVMKEEMYEEEDDDLPRHFRALAAHLQTSSADMNSRLSAYLTNQVAMASLARQQEVNRMFAEQFPNASQISQQIAQSMYLQPLQQPDQASHPPQSVLPASATTNMSPQQAASPSPSPPGLTPGSGSSETPLSHSTPAFTQSPSMNTALAPAISTTSPIDPALTSLHQPGLQSSFTSELPQETKLMANIDITDPLAGVFYGDAVTEPAHPDDTSLIFPPTTIPFEHSPVSTAKDHQHTLLPPDFGYFVPNLQLSNGSRIGTPGGGDGDAWDAWVNTEEWNHLSHEAHGH
jgi:hypothetical protein